MSASMQKLVEEFMRGGSVAVVGASTDRAKYGNKVLRAWLQAGKFAVPVHPKETSIEGQPAFPSLSALTDPVENISVITPPKITEAVVEEAAQCGVRRIWMQPGAESERAIELARELGMDVIHGGPCVLVAVRFQDSN